MCDGHDPLPRQEVILFDMRGFVLSINHIIGLLSQKS